MNTCTISIYWLLWITQSWTFVYNFCMDVCFQFFWVYTLAWNFWIIKFWGTAKTVFQIIYTHNPSGLFGYSRFFEFPYEFYYHLTWQFLKKNPSWDFDSCCTECVNWFGGYWQFTSMYSDIWTSGVFGFGIRVLLVSQEWVGHVPSSLIFCKCLWQDSVNYLNI